MNFKDELEKLIHSLAEKIADEFGGDVDEHPQKDLEVQALTSIINLVDKEKEEAYKKGYIAGGIDELKKVGCCDYWKDGCCLNVCQGEQLGRIAELEAL